MKRLFKRRNKRRVSGRSKRRIFGAKNRRFSRGNRRARPTRKNKLRGRKDFVKWLEIHDPQLLLLAKKRFDLQQAKGSGLSGLNGFWESLVETVETGPDIFAHLLCGCHGHFKSGQAHAV